MITMSYTGGVLAAVAAAAMGAAGAGWMLYGAIVENRLLVARIERWERRTAHTPLWTSRLSGYHTTGFYGLHTTGPRPRVLDGRVLLTLPASAASPTPASRPAPAAPSASATRSASSVPSRRLAITTGVDRDDDFDFESIVDDRDVESALRRNRAEVRRALRHTERLLVQSRRQHVARHRLNPAPPPRPRRSHATEIGRPAFPWRTSEAVAA